MDYEKMYKAVLKTATQWFKDSCSDKVKTCLECIFPELRESEDERIRRTLVEYFGPGAQLDFIRGVPTQKIRDWLEKQKESHYTKRNALFDKCVENCDPKTVEEVNKRVDDIMNMPELSAFEQALTNLIGYWEDDEEKWPSKFVKKHSKHILDMAREELQKEQKEIPLMNGDADLYFDEWNQQHSNPTKRECFEAGMLYAVRLLTEDSPMLEEFKKGLEQVILWGKEGYKVSPDGTTKSLTQDEIDEVLDEQKEQKPNIEICPHSIKSKSYKENGYPIEYCDYGLEIAQDILEKTLGKVEGFQTDDGIREHQTAIKAVKDAMKEQNPAAWSDDDEAILSWCISDIERAKYCKSQTKPELCDREIAWLKSLRPQPKDEIYKEKDKAYKLGKHHLAVEFMTYLDKNRPEGKMYLSKSECEDIDKAFKENDWAKIMRYVEKYRPSWKPSEEQKEALEYVIRDYREDSCDATANYLQEILDHLKTM